MLEFFESCELEFFSRGRKGTMLPNSSLMLLTYLTKSLFWDSLIFLFILSGGMIAAYGFWTKQKPPWVRALLITTGSIFTLTIVYGSFIEPRMITITEGSIILPTVDDLTIAAISDLHVGPYKGKRYIGKVVEKINALEPDLVFLLGDYVYFGGDPRDDLVPLQNLRARYGVFGVMGNHEYGCMSGGEGKAHMYGTFDASRKVRRSLERSGVTMLNNESVEIDLEDDGLLFVAGIDDACSMKDDVLAALPEITQKSSIILLAHDPSVILDNQTTYAHLIVAGHTHGGQIRLPFIGPVPSLPTQLPRSYDQGLFPIDQNTVLALTRGVGESGPRARLFAPPEILLLRMKN